MVMACGIQLTACRKEARARQTATAHCGDFCGETLEFLSAMRRAVRSLVGLTRHPGNSFESAVQTEHSGGTIHRVGKTRHLRVAYRLPFFARLLIHPLMERRFESRIFKLLDRAP